MRGRDTITESEFVLDASLKLRWFSPKDAQKLLQVGVDCGLLRSDGGNVHAAFDVASVAVPVNYRPGPEAIAPPKGADLFGRILARIRSATGESTPPIVARINQVQERLGVDAEVAAAHLAALRGVGISDLLAELESEVLRRSG
jgi:hypothetical protein